MLNRAPATAPPRLPAGILSGEAVLAALRPGDLTGALVLVAQNLAIGVAAMDRAAGCLPRGGRGRARPTLPTWRLAEMQAGLEAARALVERAAAAIDLKSPDAAHLCDAARLFTAQEVYRLAAQAVELQGWRTGEADVETGRLLRGACRFLRLDEDSAARRERIVARLFAAHRAGGHDSNSHLLSGTN